MHFDAAPVAELPKLIKNVGTLKSLYRSQFSIKNTVIAAIL